MRFLPVDAFDDAGAQIESGVRVERLLDGSVLVARERFELGGTPRGVAVPASLGGGFLFYQPVPVGTGTGTALYRARSWTAELQPLGLVPMAATDVKIGFDRFYLLGSGRVAAVDPDRGTPLDLSPLPPLVTLFELSFTDATSARVRGPLVGELETHDAGRSWTPVALAPDATGAPDVRPKDALPRDASSSAALPQWGRLLRQVVLRGMPLPSGRVFALVSGERVLFDLERASFTHQPEPGLSGSASCQALTAPREAEARAAPVEGGAADEVTSLLWFSCRAAAAPGLASVAELRAYGWSKAGPVLRRVVREPAGAQILAAGPRGVLLSGSCPGASLTQRGKRALCLVTGTKLWPLEAPPSNASRAETFAVGSGAVHRVSLAPDGSLWLERLDAPEPRRVHRLHPEREVVGLVTRGSWLPSATISAEGTTLWAVQGESYVGVRLEAGGSTRVGAIQRPLRRAFFAGARALSWGASGFARVSTDGGMTFDEVTYPFVSGDSDPNAVRGAQGDVELGCGPAGCSLGSWLSVGWEVPRGVRTAPLPTLVPLPPPGGGRFRFSCSYHGERTAAALELGFRAPRARAVESGETPLFPPFWDRSPPRLAAFEEGVSAGDVAALARVYAWGPKDVAWGAKGLSEIVFRSPFHTEIFATAPSRGLFSDAVSAKAALGVLDRTTQVVSAEIDPEGESGAVLLRTRQETHLLLFERGSSIERIVVPDHLELHSLSGAVLSRGVWHLGSVRSGEFRLLHVERRAAGAAGPRSGRAQLAVVAAFPLGETGPREASLVRSQSGELAIAMDGDSGLYLFPVSPAGELGDAIEVPFRGSHPPPCAAEATGYWVVRELGIAPYVEVRDQELDVSRVTMRRVVGFGPECIDALAADARSGFDPGLPSRTRTALGTPLVVTDRVDSGERYRLYCQ